MKRKEKGFTLIELLIVIGIIAILAAAVIIAINPGRQFTQARNATRWSHINSVVNAIYAYAIDNNGTFPSCATGTEVLVSTCADDLTTTYMQALPADPQAPTYAYWIKAEGTRVEVWSKAPEAITEGVKVTQ